MTLLDGLMIVAVIVITVGVAVLIRVGLQLGRAAEDISNTARRTDALFPTMQRVLENSAAMTRASANIAEDVRTVTSSVSAVTEEVRRGIESEAFHRVRAAVVGARAGYEVFRRHQGNGNGPEREHDHVEG